MLPQRLVADAIDIHSATPLLPLLLRRCADMLHYTMREIRAMLSERMVLMLCREAALRHAGAMRWLLQRDVDDLRIVCLIFRRQHAPLLI